MERLTAAFVKSIERPGRYGDGRGGFGLSLLVKPARRGMSKSWSQRLRLPTGKTTNKGLGAFPAVSLGAARSAAIQNYAAVQEGRLPATMTRDAAALTFRKATDEAIALRAGLWRSGSRTEAQWRTTFDQYVFPAIGERTVDSLTARDLLGVLGDLNVKKPATAKKIHQWIKSVFDWAVASGLRQDNPAGGALLAALPRNGKTTKHHRALPHAEVAGALATIRASRAWASTKLAFEFLILTACRSGEVRGARWAEVDLQERTWTVPASRMKANREHRIPLSDRAVEVLHEARALGSDDLIFPSTRGRPLTDIAFSKLMKQRGIDAVPHGFRSSFRDWAGETGQDRAVAEASLAHTLGNQTEAAYARSDLFGRRRSLMQAWAVYLAS